MQAALEKELEDTEKAETNGDAEMGGVEAPKAEAEVNEEDEASEAGSEDLEADSSDDDEEDEEDEGGENGENGENGEDMEMADGEEKPAQTNGEIKPDPAVKQAVMAH